MEYLLKDNSLNKAYNIAIIIIIAPKYTHMTTLPLQILMFTAVFSHTSNPETQSAIFSTVINFMHRAYNS